MKITKKLKNYQITRTRIYTMKHVATTEVLAVSASAAADKIKESDSGYENHPTGTILSVDEQVDIQEVK